MRTLPKQYIEAHLLKLGLLSECKEFINDTNLIFPEPQVSTGLSARPASKERDEAVERKRF